MSKRLIAIDTGRPKPYFLEVTHQDVSLRGLPKEWHGATLVHISDMHGGYGNTDPVHEEAIAQVNALKPDLILFTGDYIDDHISVKDHPIHETLSQFKARYGKYGSFGNHDHRRGVVGIRHRLEKGGVRVLNNESLCVGQGLWLAGVDDLFEGKPDFERAMRRVPDDKTAIVLSHNPSLIRKAGRRDVFILSGHTHGAQIRLPFPTPWMVCVLHLGCRQVAGWYQNGRARLYVNRGLGVTGKPFRYRCPAEIAVFRLVPDPAEVKAPDDALAAASYR